MKMEDYDEDIPDFEVELVEAGWNIIRENPGIECAEWINLLIEQYPLEVVDALGNNPIEVFPMLEDWWEQKDYTDPDTGEWNTLAGWSEYFATDPDALRNQLDVAEERIRELERELEDAKREISRLKA